MRPYRNPDFWLYIAIIAAILVALGLAIKYSPKQEGEGQALPANWIVALEEVQEYYPALTETITPEQAIKWLEEARASHDYYSSDNTVAVLAEYKSATGNSFQLDVKRERMWVERYGRIIQLLEECQRVAR